MKGKSGKKVIAQDRKARHNYTIEDVYEAGIALVGTEVKSLRAGRASLVDGFVQIEKDEQAYLQNVHIPEYTKGSWTNHDPKRKRKLLLHKYEIKRLIGKTTEKGLTIIPLSLYFIDGIVKVEIALARGKKQYDKRQDIATKEAKREASRAIGRRFKGMSDD